MLASPYVDNRDMCRQFEELIRKVKPCNLPCPKCGAENINRNFYAKGDVVDFPQCRKLSGSVFADSNLFHCKAKKEFINHFCRVCCFHWQTDTLETKQMKEIKKVFDKSWECGNIRA